MDQIGASTGGLQPSLGEHPGVVAVELGRRSAVDLGLSLLAVGGLARDGTSELWLAITHARAIACVDTVIAHTATRGMRVTVKLADERWVSASTIREWARLGLYRMVATIEASDPSHHDRLRGTMGSFAAATELAAATHAAGVQLEIETHWQGQSESELESVLGIVGQLRGASWIVVFPIETSARAVTSSDAERILEFLAEASEQTSVAIDTRNAPQYRRVLRERRESTRPTPHGSSWRPTLNDGRGLLCIDDDGRILPSDCLRIDCGTVKRDDPLEVYRFHPTFRTLRDTELFEMPCRTCDFRASCGGSRARAYARTGRLLAADPLCSYLGRIEKPSVLR